MIKVLAVDDEEPFRRLLKKELTRKGFVAATASSGKEALAILKEESYDVILLDIVMPGSDGISLMKKLKGRGGKSPEVIFLTGQATIETAVTAMKYGAYDYLTKPYKLDELVIVINRAYEYSSLRLNNQLLKQELVRKEVPDDFIAVSREMKGLLALVRKIAPTDSAVFVQGESGTGKELIANTIWQYSRRSEAPLIALNCAALSETLIESELFGHEKGAFTNAYQAKYGLVEVADKGTLFLDEIGEMPVALQAKLLRFLDSGEFRRVGSNKTMNVDVRVIAATNKDLKGPIAEGRFREDLFYRLNVINLHIPPLRERSDDIPTLARHFLKKYCMRLSKEITDFSAGAMELLMGYDWPGNVRELENIIERGVILCESETIEIDCLSLPAISEKTCPANNPSLEDIEKEYILRVLRENEGNQTKASQVLGIDRKTLYHKLKKYGLGDYIKK